jgi:3-oxoacyl-[acyl-carrier protein] reductase
VQTPNRWYPIETHLLTPLLHFLPMRIQRLLARRWTVWDLIERPSPDRRAFYIEHYLNTIRLLTASELRALFPGSRLLRERHLGFTKSLIVVKTLWILHSGARRCQNRAEMIFQNRTALVTGASRGIGKAIALRLASEGVAVGVNYRERADEAEGVAAEIVARGGRAVTAGADVSDESAVAAMVAKVEAELGPIDILINNAGIFRRMELGEVDWDVMEQMQRTNVRGVVVPIRAVVEGMRKRGHGRIINLSSLAAHGTSMAGTTFYAATKAEVVILTRRFALELGPCGITVNAIAPGFIATDLVWVDRTKQEVEHLFATLAGKAMMRRVGQPEDIAAAAVYLASDEAGFITAQVITVDGGRTDYINHG